MPGAVVKYAIVGQRLFELGPVTLVSRRSPYVLVRVAVARIFLERP